MTGQEVRGLALFGLIAAGVAVVLTAWGTWLDNQDQADPDPGPPGWMLAEVIENANQITREAAGGTDPR